MIEASHIGKIKLHYYGALSFLRFNNENLSIFIPEVDSASIIFSEHFDTLIQVGIYLDKEIDQLGKPASQ